MNLCVYLPLSPSKYIFGFVQTFEEYQRQSQIAMAREALRDVLTVPEAIAKTENSLEADDLWQVRMVKMLLL